MGVLLSFWAVAFLRYRRPVSDDPHDLARFIEAQAGIYETALAELRAGHKHTHWMWFIFPQVKGLGSSWNSTYYGIGSSAEARAYLEHPVLGGRLVECTAALLEHDGVSAAAIMGPVDALKLRSSLTLFSAVSSAGSVFHRGLELFFGGEPDERTLAIVDG